MSDCSKGALLRALEPHASPQTPKQVNLSDKRADLRFAKSRCANRLCCFAREAGVRIRRSLSLWTTDVAPMSRGGVEGDVAVNGDRRGGER